MGVIADLGKLVGIYRSSCLLGHTTTNTTIIIIIVTIVIINFMNMIIAFGFADI